MALLLLTACSSPATESSSTAVADTDTAASGALNKRSGIITSLCFLRTEGKSNMDTTNVQLVIKGDTVSGEMDWRPYQKDGRKGVLEGKMHGDTARVLWTFKQEGVTDTLGLNFKLDSSRLVQRPLKLNKKTGRQQTDESAGYSVVYRPSVGSRK